MDSRSDRRDDANRPGESKGPSGLMMSNSRSRFVLPNIMYQKEDLPHRTGCIDNESSCTVFFSCNEKQ